MPRTPKRRIVRVRVGDDAEAHELYKQVTQLIGEVAGDWAQLDQSLVSLLRLATKCPAHAAEVIYHSMNSFSPRLSMIKATVMHCMTDAADQQTILAVLEKLRSLHNRRNDLIHSSYATVHGRSDKPYLERRVVRSERTQLRSEVRAQTGEIREHIRKLGEFHQYFHMLTWHRDEPDWAEQWSNMILNTASATSA